MPPAADLGRGPAVHPPQGVVVGAHRGEAGGEGHVGARQICLLEQLLRQCRPSRSCDRERPRAELLHERSVQMATSDRQAAGEAVDTVAIDHTLGDQAQAASHQIGAHVPIGRVGARLGPAPAARTEPGTFGSRGRREEPDVLPLGHRHRTDGAAVDAGRRDADEDAPVESSFAGLDRPVRDLESVHMHGYSALRRHRAGRFRTS